MPAGTPGWADGHGVHAVERGVGDPGVLTALPAGTTKVFSQPVFAQRTLFVATEANGLYDFAP